MSQIKGYRTRLGRYSLKLREENLPSELSCHSCSSRKRGQGSLTTGRPLKAMDFLLQEIGTAGLSDEYTITFNGGLVQKNTGEIIAKTVFSRDDVVRIL